MSVSFLSREFDSGTSLCWQGLYESSVSYVAKLGFDILRRIQHIEVLGPPVGLW